MARRPLLALLAVAVAVPLRHASGADVRVVAPSGTPYATIQAAVDASADGDVVLVRAGNYAAFHLVSKSVCVVADQNATVSIAGAIRVRNCSSTVVLAGLDGIGGTGPVPAEHNALTASGNTGALRVQNCFLFGAPNGPACDVRHGALVQDCPNVAIGNSVLSGGNAGGGFDSSSHGLVALHSSMAIHDATLLGGRGACAVLGYTAGDGGDGLRADLSDVFLARSEAHGGDGNNHSCFDGGNGGNGIYAVGAATHVQFRQTTLTGGAGAPGNSPAACPCPGYLCCAICFLDGNPGSPWRVDGGAQVTPLGGIARALTGPDVAREGTAVPLTCVGEPGDFVGLWIARAPAFVPSPAQHGVRLVAPVGVPSRLLILGTVPGTGVLQATLQLPDLPPGQRGDVWHLQALHRAADGTSWLSGPLALVVLDGSI